MRPDSIGPVPKSLLKPWSLLHRPQRLPLLQQTFQSSKESQLKLELWQTPVKFGVCHFRPCWPSVVLGRPQSSLSKWTEEMWSWYHLVTPCREDNTGLREQMQSDTVTTYWKEKYILDISSSSLTGQLKWGPKWLVLFIKYSPSFLVKRFMLLLIRWVWLQIVSFKPFTKV